MSGRGRSRGHGRSGRGHSGGRGSGRSSYRSRGNNNNGSNNENEKIEFTPHYAGKAQGATCDTVKKQIVHEIRGKCECGNDLAESLDDDEKISAKEELWKKLGFAEETIVDENKPTQLELVRHTEFIKNQNERFRVYQDNVKKAYSLIYGCCNKAMQIRLENDSDFENTVKGDPFETMKAIKLKMHDPSKVKCPFVTIFEQLDRLFNAKQEDEESLNDYTKRFKQAQDNVKSIMGEDWLHHFTENTEEFINASNSAEEDELKKNSNERFMAYAFLRNCDTNK